MSSAVKRLAKDSAIYGISTILARFLNFLLTPFYTQIFVPSDFGIISTFFSLMAFLNILFMFGLPQAYLRFASDTKEEDRRLLYSTVQFLILGITVVLSLILLTGSPFLLDTFRFPESLGNLVIWMVLILLMDSLCAVPQNDLRLDNRSLTFSAVKLTNIAVNLTGNFVFLLYFETGIIGVFYANALASAVTLFLSLYLTRQHVSLLPSIKWESLKPLFLFSLPLIPTGFGSMINEVSDRLFIQRLDAGTIQSLYPASAFSSPDLVGFYSAAHKLGIVMMLVVQMFNMAWTPFFLNESKKPGWEKSFSGIFSLFLFFLIFLGFLFSFFMDDLLKISIGGYHLIPPSYWFGLQVVPFVVLSYIFNGTYYFFTFGLYLEKKTSRILTIMLAGVGVTILGNLILLPLLGIVGSAITLMICYFTMSQLMFRQSQKMKPIPIDKVYVTKLILVSLPFWVLAIWHQMTQSLDLWMKLVALAGFIGLIFSFKLWTIEQSKRLLLLIPGKKKV
ncbi:MAG: oligosaccharide flippase family protein [Bacteroidetes bacterium]|nr:oligosaccharide flippase family protein [Bacteroidota bacterium]